MSRTAGYYQQDSAFTDFKIVLNPYDFVNTGAGTATYTVNAKGDISLNAAASQTLILNATLAGMYERLGFPLFLQEQFGTAAGVAGPSSVANTSDPAANQGYPPFTGATQLTPRTGNIPKGVKINNIVYVYEATTVDLSAHTFGLSKTVYPTPGTPAALAVTDVFAAATINKVHNAAPQSSTITISSPAFNVTDLSDMNIAIGVTTASTGAYRFYRCFLHCSVNFN